MQDPSRAHLRGEGDETGAITSYSTQDVHLAGGVFDPERLYRFWRDRAEEVRAAGAYPLRAVAEMVWALQGVPGTDRAGRFESGLTAVLSSLPISVICQYGSTRFAASTVAAMLLSHPLVVIGERVFHNPFYLPDEAFAERSAHATSDPVGALLPMWRFYLRGLAGEDEVGPFLCNSLPSFIPGASIAVLFAGRASGWHLDPDHDVLQEVDLPACRTTAASRLFAAWPRSSDSLGGSVDTGNDGLWWVEASFGDHARGIALSRPARFTRGELLLFTTLAGAVASVLAGTGPPGGPA